MISLQSETISLPNILMNNELAVAFVFKNSTFQCMFLEAKSYE